MGAPVRLQKAVPRFKEKRRSGAPKGAPVRVMDRQFPPAGGTGSAVRRANGCGVPRPRISALRFPLLGLRRVRNRQFGTTVRRDAPRGNAPARPNTMDGGNHDAEICAHDSPPSCPRLSRASTPFLDQNKAWMAGTCPAMTNIGSAQAVMGLAQRHSPFASHGGLRLSAFALRASADKSANPSYALPCAVAQLVCL